MLDAFIKFAFTCEICFQNSTGRIFSEARLITAHCWNFGFLRGVHEAFLSKEPEEES